jgi:hypothetical protein
MTCSLGDTAEDARRWWQAYQLAENDRDGELRQCAEWSAPSFPDS